MAKRANPLEPDAMLLIRGHGEVRNVTYYPPSLAKAMLDAEQAIQRVCREARFWLVATPQLEHSLNRLLMAQHALLGVQNYGNACLLPGEASPVPLPPKPPRRARKAA